MIYTEWSIQHVGRFISLESQNQGLRVWEMLMAKFMQQNVQRKKKFSYKNECLYGRPLLLFVPRLSLCYWSPGFKHGLHRAIFFSIISNTVVAGWQVMGAFWTSLMVGGFWSQALLQDKHCHLSNPTTKLIALSEVWPAFQYSICAGQVGSDHAGLQTEFLSHLYVHDVWSPLNEHNSIKRPPYPNHWPFPRFKALFLEKAVKIP